MYYVAVAVDDDPRELSRQSDALESLADEISSLKILVVHVFPGDSSIYLDEEQAVQNELPDEVSDFESSLNRAHENVSLVTRKGDTQQQILEVADEYDVDSIMMAGKKRSPTGKVLFGSVTQQVVLSSDRPVTIV